MDGKLVYLQSARAAPGELTALKPANRSFAIVTVVLTNCANRAILPVTDFENKFIPSPFNSLQPIRRLAAPPFCAALFYPEFANEYYRQKSPRQPGLPALRGTCVAGKIVKKIHKQSQFSSVTVTKQTISKKRNWVRFWLSSQKRTAPAAIAPGNVPKTNARMFLDN
jgi:hypothetical protein